MMQMDILQTGNIDGVTFTADLVIEAGGIIEDNMLGFILTQAILNYGYTEIITLKNSDGRVLVLDKAVPYIIAESEDGIEYRYINSNYREEKFNDTAGIDLINATKLFKDKVNPNIEPQTMLATIMPFVINFNHNLDDKSKQLLTQSINGVNNGFDDPEDIKELSEHLEEVIYEEYYA